MNRYVKLVNFELSRFKKIYLSLLALTLVFQISGIIYLAKRYVSRANDAIYLHGMSQADFLVQNSKMNFLLYMNSFWFTGPVAICIAAFLFYILFIWYREWFGKNPFILRLFMLPTSRMTIYFSKATAIFIMVLGLIAFQVILLPIENFILESIVPTSFLDSMQLQGILTRSKLLYIVIPTTFTQFVLYYGCGFVLVLVLFTGLLLERSYRFKGIIFGIVYCALAITLFISPILVVKSLNLDNLLYPIEWLAVEVFISLMVAFVSIWLSRYLLKHKVSV